MKDKLTKVEKLGLAQLVQDLRVNPESGGERTHWQIADLLEAQGHPDCGADAVKRYLGKLDAQRAPYAEQAVKESVAPLAISSMDILTNLEQQLYQKVRATGESADKLIPCATGARALLDVIKTKMELLGIKLAKPDRPDDDIRAELDSLRQRDQGVGATSRDGQAGATTAPRLPN